MEPLTNLVNKLLLFSLSFLLTVSLFGGVVSATCSYSGTGGWNITSGEDCTNTNELIILNGNLTIYGNLTLSNVSLRVNSTHNGQYLIEVMGGGSFYINNSSNITNGPYNETANFLFWIDSGSKFTMKNSRLHHCGYAGGGSLPAEFHSSGFEGPAEVAGPYIRTDNVVIQDSEISDNYIGLIFVDSNYATFTNNNISDNEAHGIYFHYFSHNLFRNNTISHNNGSGIWGTHGSNFTIENNSFLYNREKDGYDYRYNSEISIDFITYFTLKNNTLIGYTYNSWGCWGAIFDSVDYSTIEDNYMDTGRLNTFAWGDSNHGVIRNNIITGSGWGISFEVGHNVTITNNYINAATTGIRIKDFTGQGYPPNSNITISNNVININDTIHSSICGISISSKNHDIHILNNTITGTSPYKYGHPRGIVLSTHTHNITIKDNFINITAPFVYSEGLKIPRGIYLDSSFDNTLINNTVFSNKWGVYLRNSSNNFMSKNKVSLDAQEYYLENTSYNNTIQDTIFDLTTIGFKYTSNSLTVKDIGNTLIKNNKNIPLIAYPHNTTLEIYPTTDDYDIILETLNFTLIPSFDSVNVTIQAWNKTEEDFYKQWNESSSNSSVATSHMIGDFPANTVVLIKKNGSYWKKLITNSSGYITFTYDEGFSAVTFEATGTPPPQINQIQCEINTTDNWVACNNTVYGSTLLGVRVNCTDSYSTITNAAFSLENIPDSSIFFNASNATSVSGDWWIYDNNDILIQDSGEWNLTASCINNESKQNSDYVNWIVTNQVPVINEILCEVNSTGNWLSCDNVLYDSTLIRVKANCTDDFEIVNVSFRLENMPDTNVFFNNNATTVSGDWWIYDNNDILIQDSGEWNLSVMCYDNEETNPTPGTDYANWTVPWGHLEPYLVDPASDKTVIKDHFFTFQAGVRCVDGECGDVNVTLDPEGTSITNCQELQDMGNDLSGTYYLANDIDCSDTVNWNTGAGFEPVGDDVNEFSGAFDGQDYTITGLYIDRSSDYVGLFGAIADNIMVSNVGLIDVDITGGEFVGGLVGWSHGGYVNNSYSGGDVEGGHRVGGLVGNNRRGTITNSHSSGSVTGNTGHTGGLSGVNCEGNISDSYSSATAVSYARAVGGLVGYLKTDGGNVGTITNCYATGNITSDGGNTAGGLVGGSYDVGAISKSYATGDVTSSGEAGGLIGCSKVDINNCYATGNVEGDQYVGGLVAYAAEGSINNSYSTGCVAGNTDVGGLVGDNDGGITVSNSYWDNETSGQSTSDGGIGKTTTEMKQQATFSGWNFTDIWAIEETVTYPFLGRQTVVPITINSITTDPSPVEINANVSCKANATTIEGRVIIWTNFTVTDPYGNKIIGNVNGTRAGDIWSSPYFIANSSGTWYCNVTASDNASNTANDFIAFTPGDKGGAVSTTVGATPFYTTSSNPQACLNMGAGDSCNKTWEVNATGSLNTTWQFFVIADATNYSSYIQGNTSDVINITIEADTTPPTIEINSPQPNQTVKGVVKISVFAEDNGTGIANVLFYNGTNYLGYDNTTDEEGNYIYLWNTVTEISVVNRTINVTACDYANNCNSAEINVTIDNTATQGTYVNDSVEIEANESVSINANTSSETNISLEIRVNANVSEGSVSISEYNETTTSGVGIPALNRYIEIKINPEIKSALDWTIIKIYYTDEEISNTGIDESTLRLYCYNETSSTWEAYDPPEGGVNTSNNYVWANTTHFSLWGLYGKLANGKSCSSGSECSGGYCVHGICRSTSTYCGDDYCDSGETCSSCSDDCGVCHYGGRGNYIPLTRQAQLWTKITPGIATIMKITNKELGLKQIQFEVKNQTNNVKITITKLEGKPASVTKELSGKTYKYLEIKTENLNETNLEKSKIQFEVNKTWITENNLDKNKIYLYRFANNEWQKLETILISETENYINYEAETPGFSYFAIADEEKVCDDGTKRCSNNKIERCVDSSWQLLETCEFGCNLTSLICNPKPTEIPEKICTEREKRCFGDELQECENNSWVAIEACDYGCNETTLTCNPKSIKPEEKNYWIYLVIIAIIGITSLALYLKRDSITGRLKK